MAGLRAAVLACVLTTVSCLGAPAPAVAQDGELTASIDELVAGVTLDDNFCVSFGKYLPGAVVLEKGCYTIAFVLIPQDPLRTISADTVYDASVIFTDNATGQEVARLAPDESHFEPDETLASTAEAEPSEQLLLEFDVTQQKSGSLFSAQEWTTTDPELTSGFIVSSKDVATCAERCIAQACDECAKENPKLSRSDLGCVVPPQRATPDEIDAGRACVVDTYNKCWERNCNLITGIFRFAVTVYSLVGTGRKVWSWLD